MSLTVKSLNADTTFLLNFAPTFAPSHAAAQFPGSFTILIDPWVTGHSSVFHTSFQISHHTTPPCISSLREIPLPDLIVISQDKPDHCHKQTLCTLPADSKVRILASPAAAKKIRSWKYFKNATVESFQPYNREKADTLVRIPIPGYTSYSASGEVTLSYLPAKVDPTKLHNAVGITYRAPSNQTTSVNGPLVNIVNLFPTPQASPTLEDNPRYQQLFAQQGPMTPPDSPMADQMNLAPLSMVQEKTLSVLYSPHGVSYSIIEPYASSYLVKENALPLTALFHSVNTEENPWLLGGIVANGYPGGAEIVAKLGARYWFSSHDEVKDNRGWSVAWIKSTRYTLEDVQQKLDNDRRNMTQNKGKDPGQTQMTSLDPGKQLRITGTYACK